MIWNYKKTPFWVSFFGLYFLRFERSEKRVLSFLDIRVTSSIYP